MRHPGHAAILLIATVGLAGCDLTGTDGDDSLNFDAAVVGADGAIEDLDMMHGPRLGRSGGVFPGLIGGRPDCPKIQDVFLCDPIEREGVTYTRAITYRDGAGNAQTAYDEATTASIEYDITVQGDRGRDGWSASINRTRQMTVTGLLDGTGQVTWNGTGTGDITRSRHSGDGSDRTYNVVSSSQVSEVSVPYPRTDDAWPLSGSITRDLSMTRTSGDSGSTRQKTVVVAFDGTQFASVTVDGETFTVDLTERRPGPRNMARGRR